MSKPVSIILLAFSFNLMLLEDRQIFATGGSQTLEIQMKNDGVAMVEARIELLAPPDVVFTVLTDYHNWPILFPDGVEIEVERFSKNHVVTDMRIPHKVLSWKTHLKAKSKETPPHRLETTLIEGDFLQYEQVWQLTPMQNGQYTRAELDLMLQPKGWIRKLVPGFLYRWILRGDLEEHFKKFRRRVNLRNGTQIKKAR